MKRGRSFLEKSSKNLWKPDKNLDFPKTLKISIFSIKNVKNIGFIWNFDRMCIITVRNDCNTILSIKLSRISSSWQFHFLNMLMRRLTVFTKQPQNYSILWCGIVEQSQSFKTRGHIDPFYKNKQNWDRFIRYFFLDFFHFSKSL
jgi:hypothetical protein